MSARLAPFLQASAFAFRSFPLLFRLPLAFAPSGNKRHHHLFFPPRGVYMKGRSGPPPRAESVLREGMPLRLA